MARVNGKKRETRRLQARMDHFKNFRQLYPTFNPTQIDGNERRIQALADRIAEL